MRRPDGKLTHNLFEEDKGPQDACGIFIGHGPGQTEQDDGEAEPKLVLMTGADDGLAVDSLAITANPAGGSPTNPTVVGASSPTSGPPDEVSERDIFAVVACL